MNSKWIESVPPVSVDDLDQEDVRRQLLEAEVIFGTDSRSSVPSIFD
jgi:hypothetical protein